MLKMSVSYKNSFCKNKNSIHVNLLNIPKPVWAVGFALEQALHVVALAVFSFLILKRLQHN
jgi:hypothetical protein